MRKFLLGTRRGILILFLLILGGGYGIYRYFASAPVFNTPDDAMYIFPGVNGPDSESVIVDHGAQSWRSYHSDNAIALAILLTDTTAQWIGLAHGLAGIGIPFIFTTDVAEAIRHKVVMIYPLVSGKVLRRKDLQALAAVPRNGGALIASAVYGGGLNEVFAFDSVVSTNARRKLMLAPGSRAQFPDTALWDIFADAIDHEILMGGGSDIIPTAGYTQAQTPLVNFDDGQSCLVYKDYGAGKAYAVGIDLGNYILKNLNGRGIDSFRAYANRYDGGVDIWLRMLKHIYETGEPDAVTIGTVPYNKPFTLVLTHDIDFTRSIVNAARYASMEKGKGVRATYFIQTKYVRDWNDDIFFNDTNVKYLLQVRDAEMEIGSHSVSHSISFAHFELGSGKEKYPTYRPFVKEQYLTYNGTVLGELRVSKYLIEHFVPGIAVSSFRPGHLQCPATLPQALEATGYRNNSSMTSAMVQTYLPFIPMYDRKPGSETNIVEIPVAVEDELGLPLNQRFDSTVHLATTLSKYGGVLNILLHTDILGQKYEYEQRVIDCYKDTAWVATISELGEWWRLRNGAKVSVKSENNNHIVTVQTTGLIKGLTLRVPRQWKLQAGNNSVHQYGSSIVIDELNNEIVLTFGKGK